MSHLGLSLVLASSSASDTATGVGIPVAILAGLVSFLSPCVLPLVPGYLSTVIGVTPAEIDSAGTRRVLVPSLLFIASFSLIFILLGLTATALGSSLNAHKATLEQVGGVLIILMGVVFLATPFIDRLNFQWHSESLMRFAGRRRAAACGGGVCDRVDSMHKLHARRDSHPGRDLDLSSPWGSAAGFLRHGAGDSVPADRACLRACHQHA